MSDTDSKQEHDDLDLEEFEVDEENYLIHTPTGLYVPLPTPYTLMDLRSHMKLIKAVLNVS